MVFVKNATAGVNAVVRQLQLGPGDACLIADQTYGACANTVRDACTKAGAECISLQTGRDALVSDDIFAAALEQQLTAAPHIKFALLDHITSPSAVLLPVAR
jgi:isopenicillin-N epimerase